MVLVKSGRQVKATSTDFNYTGVLKTYSFKAGSSIVILNFDGGVSRQVNKSDIETINGVAPSGTLSTFIGQMDSLVEGQARTDISYSGVLTTNSPVAAQAAVTAKKTYVKSLQYQNTNGTATTILVLSGSTVIAQFNAPANMATPVVVPFDPPISTAVNTALNVNCGTTAANVLTNIQGYQE